MKKILACLIVFLVWSHLPSFAVTSNLDGSRAFTIGSDGDFLTNSAVVEGHPVGVMAGDTINALWVYFVATTGDYVWAATYYISPSGDGSDGTTWAKAYQTIQAALNARNLAAHVFEIDGGASGQTYAESISMQYAGTTLRGSTDSGRNGLVRIDASAAGTHALTINSKANCILQNFELYGASGSNYGLLNNASGTTATAIRLTSNGRGIYNNSTITLNRSVLWDNTAYSVYTQNTAGATTTLNSSILYATKNSIVYGYYYNTILNNCTIYSNGSIPIDLALASSQNVTVKNSIIYRADSGYLVRVAAISPLPTMDYNCFYGGSATPFSDRGTDRNFASWQTESSQDAHSLNADPLFKNLAGSDWSLKPGSPAIDAGTPITGLHTSGSQLITGGDAAGNTKLYGSGIDIGAYERKKFNEGPPVLNGIGLFLFDSPEYYIVP